MTTPLPANPSIENLKKQAKALQKSWQAAVPAALERIRAVHPRYAGASNDQLREAKARLADCQLVLAREAGFESWPRLKAAVQSANQQLSDRFIDAACLCYDDPHYDHRSFHARAHELLRDYPGLATANIWSAATAGNAAAVRSFLDENPALVNCAGGPHLWAPLICACYSRVRPVNSKHSTFEVARLLLDRGADPNAHMMKHNDPPGSDRARRFTALTGVFGGGSTGMANQPAHPRWRELAELLLERGANPADEEALSINQGACLEILLRHGLQPGGRELCRAARGGYTDRVKLLLAYQARTDVAFEGRTPWQHAMERGHHDIARLLEEAGAPTSELNEVDRFVSLCMAGEEAEARAMLARAPGLLDRAPKDMVRRAAEGGRAEALNLVLDLGCDPDWMDDGTALHCVAGAGKKEMARLLMKRGASLMLREPWYDGTAVGWADFFDHADLRDMLLSEGAICLFDALDYERLDRVAGILERDPAALNRPFAGCLSRKPSPEDWQTPLARMVGRGKVEAVRVLLEHGADATARHPDGRPLLQVARDKGFEEIASLLQQ